MLVRDLISLLQSQDPNALVVIPYHEDEHGTAGSCYLPIGGNSKYTDFLYKDAGITDADDPDAEGVACVVLWP